MLAGVVISRRSSRPLTRALLATSLRRSQLFNSPQLSSIVSPFSSLSSDNRSGWRRLFPAGFLAAAVPSAGSLCEPLGGGAGQVANIASTPVDVAATSVQSGLIPNVSEAAGMAVSPAAEVAANHAEIISQMAQEHWFNVAACMRLVGDFHTYGLPWWGSIIAVTFVCRLALIPVALKTVRSTAKFAILRPEMKALEAEFNRQKAMGKGAEYQMDYQGKLMKLFKKHNTSPFVGMLMPMCSVPIFVTLFCGFQAVCVPAVPGMVTGGLFWFQNLAAPDPLYILPVTSSMITFATIRRNSEGMAIEANPQMKPMLKVMSGVTLLSPILTSMFPSGINMYFCVMSLFSLTQGEILKTDLLRRLMGVPTLRETAKLMHAPPPNVESNPYIETVAKEQREKESKKEKAREDLQFYAPPETKFSNGEKPVVEEAKSEENRRKWQALMVPRKKQASGSKKKASETAV